MRGFSMRVVVLPVLLVLLGAAGCSAPAAPSAAGPSAAPSSVAPPTGAEARACLDVTRGAPWHGMVRVDGDQVSVDAYDDYFSPSCLVVPEGRAVTMVLTDRGHLPHTLMADGSTVAASVDAGQTAFVALPEVRQPLELACDLHLDERMVLAVVPEGGEGV